MRALSPSELRLLVESADFSAWWDDFVRARADHDAAAARVEETLSQAALMAAKTDFATLRANEHNESAAIWEAAAVTLQSDAAQTETRSYEAVEAFEQQRNRTTAAWHRVNALETALGEQSSTKSGKMPSAAMLLEAKVAYERDQKRKDEIWAEVVQLWERNLELEIESTEKLALAERARRRADAFTAEVGMRKERAERLRAEAAEARAAQRDASLNLASRRDAAQSRFGCTPGEEFLFFADNERPTFVLALSLTTDDTAFGIAVRPLTIFEAERGLGVQSLRSTRENSAA